MSQFLEFDVVDETGAQNVQETMTLPEGEVARDEVGGDAELTIEVDVTKSDVAGEYLVEGNFEGHVPLVCARCLETFPFASSSAFTVRYEPRPVAEEAPREEDVEFGDDSIDLEFYEERRIALRALASEQLQLSIPMKVLCREDCAGLCPQCGANRNENRCGCSVEKVDDRWKALEGIRKQLKDEKD